MEYAATKLEKGGSCSRAILTRFEHFLYGPLMSAEEKKTQERIICIEECLSCSSSQPTTHHNEIFLRRLEKIIVNPPAFDLSANHPHIQELRQELDTARSVNSKLRPATCRKFAKFLNPEGEIVVNFNPSLDSRRPNAETSSSPRKERSIAESSRVPSSQNRHTLSETTATPLRDIFSSLVPSSHYPPPSALSSSSLSSVPTSPQSTVDSIDLFEDIMASFTPSKRQKKRPASRGEMPPPGYNARVSTAVWGSSQEPAVSGRKSSISGDKALEALVPTVPGTQSSTVNNNGAAALMPPTSGIQPSDKHNNNSTALIPSGATSGAQLLPSEVPKRLLTIFLAKQSAILPILDIDQIKAGLNVAVDHGLIKPNNVNPTIALCLAIACHLTRDQNLWGSQKWYDAAVSKLPAIEKSEHSLSYFNRRILQTEYLHIVGNLNKAWAVLSMTIGEAEMLKMQTPHGGCLVVGQKSLEQVRLVWQCLWTKKLLLALQLGITTQSFDMFDDPPMPLRSHIENNMSPDGVTSNELRLATSSFFFACSSLFKLADDLILLEKTLRAKRAECPMKWLSTAELCGFYEMHGNLTRWREELHESLKWNGPGIGLEMKDPLIRRMCVLAHMRFVYFRLRQYRPFFILTLRLSLSCVCKSGPHISFKNIDDPESHPAFGTIYYSATKCLSAAQDIVKTTRSVFEKEMDELSNSEFLDYLYAAALILIAARAAPFLAKGTMSGISASSTISKSFTTMTNNIQHVDRILRMYEENCEQSPELKHRIECARSALSSIGLQCLSSGHVISDKNLNFAPIVWQSIYSRIGVEVLFKKYPNDANVLVRGRESTFGWLESLPFDMET